MELKALTEQLTPNQRTVFDLVDELDEKGAKTGAKRLAIELRKCLPEEARPRKREESPKRAHEFLSASSLAEYLKKYGSADTVVFADPEAETVFAILDEKAEKGFQIVSMKPAPHPLWTPWAKLAGFPKDVKDFAKFVTENRRTIVDPDARALMLDLSQIRASVSIEVQKGRGKSAVNGVMVTTEVKGSRQEEAIDLPDTIKIKAPLYVDTEARELELDLCIEAHGSGEVTVLVTSSAVAEAKVQAFADMIALIRAAIESKGATFTFGRPKHADWSYLRELKSE